MNDVIQEKLANLPEKPGIYRMLDARGNIIYIGKSKCLKNRVHSYFVPDPVWDKAKKMAPFIVDISYTVTPTHLEAMLLECQSIKEIKPYFNSMMKNDKRYVYMKVEEDRRKKPLTVSHIKEDDCFGPFRSKSRTEELIKAMEYLYPIVKTRGKYRFEYHVFPQVLDEEAFRNNRKILLELFKKQSAMELVIQETEKQMQKAAKAQKYELACKYRDYVQSFTYLNRSLNSYRNLTEQELVYAVPIEEGYRLFYIKDGLVEAKKTVKNLEQQVLDSFIRETAETENMQWKELSDKEKMDYRGIVYWELAEAEKGQIYMVNESK